MANLSALIKRWRGGDQRAAEAIYNQHRDAAFRLAYGLLGNHADAEEAAQDALGYALTHIDRFDPGRAGFTTWLHTITVSRCRDKRRRKRLPSLSLGRWLRRGGNTPDPALSPERHTVRTETRAEVWAAVQALKPKYREAIVLRYWSGHTYHEMADILNCPLRTAQSRVRQGYGQLRARLSEKALAANLQPEKN